MNRASPLVLWFPEEHSSTLDRRQKHISRRWKRWKDLSDHVPDPVRMCYDNQCRVAANHEDQFSNGSCRFGPGTSAIKSRRLFLWLLASFRLAVHAEAPRVSGSGLVRAQEQRASTQVRNSMDPLQLRWPAPLVYLPMREKGREIIRHGLDHSMSALPWCNLRIPAARGKRSQIPPGLPN